RTPRRAIFGFACTSIVLLVLCILLLGENRSLKVSNPRAPLPAFWQTFLGDKPTSIVVPAPVQFYWPERHVLVRDLAVSDFSAWPSSPALVEFAKKWGPPLQDQRFVMARDVFAAGRLLQYLEDHGKQAQLLGSPNLSVEDSASQNVIFVGGPRTMDRYEELLARSNFQVAASNPTL